LPATLDSILGPEGSIARRLGEKYEYRPQQMEMAAAVERAFAEGHHLLVEAGTGVGKSFAYLLPAIDYAVKNKKRVVISTHTISLQEQLIEKDIPLIQSVYPDEFTAVLVKGRNNYLCQRRLEQTRGRQNYLFEYERQRESLWMIEEWAQRTTDGSLADLPNLPESDVWDKVCAEHGNCLGKRCNFYDKCFWQSAKRRMNSGNVLVVNHALFFSDLALRMAGVNYLPKYDLVVLDEAHTVEDVAGQHFGLKIGEAGLRYVLRNLYDTKRGKGLLSTQGARANDAIRDILELEDRIDGFFDRCIAWQERQGRGNGRIHQPGIVQNDLTPKLRDLSLHVKAMLIGNENEEEISELTSRAERVSVLAETLEAIVAQTMPDAVYWMDIAGRTPKRVTLNAAPINVGEGLKRELFEKLRSVVLTSATLCTGGTRKQRITGVSPVLPRSGIEAIDTRHGAHLPHWTKDAGIYAVTFCLADSVPQSVLSQWEGERKDIEERAKQMERGLSADEVRRLKELHGQNVLAFLDRGHGECWLKRDDIAQLMADALQHHNGDRFCLMAWCIMPNHVHAVLRTLPGVDLHDILHSWKSFTAHRMNNLLGRQGTVWQTEYYDHLVRDVRDLEHSIDYAWNNPRSAGLKDWKWVWRANGEQVSAIIEAASEVSAVQEVEQEHGRDARDTDNAFAYIKSRLGVIREKTLQLGSPFDYASQATLYIETDLPDPNDTLRFLPAAGEKIVKYLRQTNGGAFVLFTSYKMLIDAANALKPVLDELGYPILVQGQGAPRKILLDRFRSTPNAVLFGTSSFWQGIDVQGDQLRNVIIVKLPFAVPDEPVTEARLDAIKRSGGNPFMEYSVPEAIIKLKQGFGRLIRSRTDKGIVVILDSRVVSKRYGRMFLEALPECRVVRVGVRNNE
jgi:Rad3-related DNA helicase/REP element-mobilizing transposase RayT